MLKNEELKQINSTITLLTMIKIHAQYKDINLNKIGIAIDDIEENIQALNNIHKSQTIKKAEASRKVAQSHKDNLEAHRIYNREWSRRNAHKKEVK